MLDFIHNTIPGMNIRNIVATIIITGLASIAPLACGNREPPDLTPNPLAVDNRSTADILATRRAVNAANDPNYATATPKEIATLAAMTPQARKLTKVQMTATVETERKTYTAGRLTEQVATAEAKRCLLNDCIDYIKRLCTKVRSGYKHHAPDAYASCRPGGTLYGYMGNLDGQRSQEGAVIRMTAVAYHPKPRPCEWKMMSLNGGVYNPRSPSECHDGSLHYSLEDFERGEDGRFDLPDHHPAHFFPAPSPTPTP